MRSTWRCYIEIGEDEVVTHATNAVAFAQCGILTVEELVTESNYCDALTSVTENLRTREHEDVVVGVTCNGGLERRLKRNRLVGAEIHAHVGMIFKHYHVIFVSHIANYLQFLVSQAYPWWVIGVRINDGHNITLRAILFELVTEFCTTEFINVELLMLYALNLSLHHMGSKTRVHI